MDDMRAAGSTELSKLYLSTAARVERGRVVSGFANSAFKYNDFAHENTLFLVL